LIVCRFQQTLQVACGLLFRAWECPSPADLKLKRTDVMAIDEDLNDRLREVLGDRAGVSEKRMMGAMCFLLHGHMIAGADRTRDGERRFIFRIGKPNHATGLALPGAEPMVQNGRTLSGLFFVGEDDCTDELLRAWLDLAISNALTLPPKGA
jgi:hypothetical protein